MNLSNGSVSFQNVESVRESYYGQNFITGEVANIRPLSTGCCFTANWDTEVVLLWFQQGGCPTTNALDGQPGYQKAKGLAVLF